MKDKKKAVETKRRKIRPPYRVWEEDGKVVLELEMPGVKRDDFEIKIENNELEIIGKRPAIETKGEYLVKERRDGDFYRVFTLDNTIDQDKIEAELSNGILTLQLSLKESEKPKLIKVKTA